MVWQVHQAVSVPILGMGGIMNGTDAVEFMLAGASAVAVGAANFTNPDAQLLKLLKVYVGIAKRARIDDVNQLIGALQC